MNTRIACAAVAAVMITAAANADIYTASYSWDSAAAAVETDGTSTYGNVDSYSSTTFAGKTCLTFSEAPLSGTPNIKVGYITGLNDGDVIDCTALGFGQGISSGQYARTRLWAHYTNEDGSYGSSGSSSRSSTSDYSNSDSEWTDINQQITFDSSKGAGIVIEARIYAYSYNEFATTYFTDLTISVDSTGNVSIVLPNTVPAPGALALLGLAGFASRRRRN